uniref:NADH dehydrogenase subunit 6 n=1 Tax=Zahniserius cylindricus TaxID=1671255 RepID=UPI0024359D33|nr:NADH dehydrogenase subunit 6 [Zahniserius cylindricus]WEU77805.1 NADH dehydrogenase subunit 6 [Zahniserius cylindricus]
MKFITLKLLMMFSTTILFLKTPMSMGVFLLAQTMVSSILITKMLTTSWISMIFFLMFIGGLMILFMYMSSIASNEKFKTSYKIIILMMILIMMPTEELLSEIQMNEFLLMFMKSETMSINKIYNKKTFSITLFMFMYMLLTMISITSIIKVFKGPLRAKKY